MPADAGRGPNSTPSSNEGDQQQMSGIAGPQLHPLVMAFGEEGGGKAVLDVLVRVAVAALTAWPGERTLQVCILSHCVVSFDQCLVLACMESFKTAYIYFNWLPAVLLNAQFAPVFSGTCGVPAPSIFGAKTQYLCSFSHSGEFVRLTFFL